MARVLIKKGADKELPDGADCSALFLACSARNLDLIRLLIDKGCNMEASSGFENGATPLIFSCKYEVEAVVRLLLSKGANVDAQDEFGFSSLH